MWSWPLSNDQSCTQNCKGIWGLGIGGGLGGPVWALGVVSYLTQFWGCCKNWGYNLINLLKRFRLLHFVNFFHFHYAISEYTPKKISQDFRVPTRTGKPGKWEGIFQLGKIQGILNRLEKSGKITPNTGKFRKILFIVFSDI